MRTIPDMRGLSTTLLIVLLNAAATSGAFASAKPLPLGAESYADDNGLWRSLRDVSCRGRPAAVATERRHPT
jgi:ABC-type sugar transport system substrate-binding protein